MAEQRSPNAIVPGGLADGPFDALDDCFRGERLLAAGTGIAVAFVLSGAVGTAASTYLLRNSLVHAALLGLVAGFLIYAGLLITYGALTRMAAAERNGLEVSPAAAFGFSLRRSHVLIAVPLFVLVVAVGAGSFFAYLGAAAARSQGFGAGLAPVALVLLFALNLLLVVAALVAHCLTAPCVACLDASSATVVARLIQVGRERLGAFLAHQAAALVVGLPLLLLTTGLFLAAFQPAFTSLAAGRAEALAQRRAQEAPARPPALPDGSAAEASRDWVERLQGWAGWAADAGGAPLLAAAAVLALLLGIFPLTYAASVQSAIYPALTGDRFVAGAEVDGDERGGPATVRRPPIVHCWRCDAISRSEAERCTKCGATLVTCPRCFATNEPDRAECSSCGEPLGGSDVRDEPATDPSED